MSKRIDYSGKKIGFLTLLVYSHSGGSAYGAIWKALCDCGTVRDVPLKNVTSGRVKTCGKCELHRKLLSRPRDGRSSVNAGEQKLFQRYLRKATSQKRDWQLTAVEFREIFRRSCDLCGSPPHNKLKGSRLIHSFVGLVDPAGHYTPGNVFPICKVCQKMKGEWSLEFLLSQIVRIAGNVLPAEST